MNEKLQTRMDSLKVTFIGLSIILIFCPAYIIFTLFLIKKAAFSPGTTWLFLLLLFLACSLTIYMLALSSSGMLKDIAKNIHFALAIAAVFLLLISIPLSYKAYKSTELIAKLTGHGIHVAAPYYICQWSQSEGGFKADNEQRKRFTTYINQARESFADVQLAIDRTYFFISQTTLNQFRDLANFNLAGIKDGREWYYYALSMQQYCALELKSPEAYDHKLEAMIKHVYNNNPILWF